MDIIRVTKDNAIIWAQLCNELWPHNSVDDMLAEFYGGILTNEFVCRIDGVYVAFLSLSARTDYVEGTENRPVGYLEGIYVKPEYRRQGIARGLIEFAKRWALENGCFEFASDCEYTNNDSRAFHNKIGFSEASINVHFVIRLKEQ